MDTMYQASAGSPVTTLSADISETDTTIPVSAPDALPPAPNLATIYDNNNFETVLYTSKDSDSITVDSRSLQGVARNWVEGSYIARLITAYDHNTFKDNLENLAADEVDFNDEDVPYTAEETQSALESIIAANVPFDDSNFGADTDSVSNVAAALNLLADSAVVDEGSTADGDYIRYENGWQICWAHDFQLSYNDNEQLRDFWDFPVSFSSAHLFVSSTLIGSISDFSPEADEITLHNNFDPSPTSVEVSLWRIKSLTDFSSDDTASMSNIAIGRWK